MATIQFMLKALNARGLSQDKIGVSVGLSQAAVSRLIRGETQNCAYRQGIKIQELYEAYFPNEVKGQSELNGLKQALLLSQSLRDSAITESLVLQRKLNEQQPCFFCKVKAFFRRK